MRSPTTVLAAAGLFATLASASVKDMLARHARNVGLAEPLLVRDGSSCSDSGSYNEDCDCCGCTCASSDYIESMCLPDIDLIDDDTGLFPSNVTAPCEIWSNMLTMGCYGNGTETIDFIAEQECMCTGGFFEYLEGCMTCEQVHGAIDTADANSDAFLFYVPSDQVSSASASFCTGTPTEDVFSVLVSAAFAVTATTASGTDLYPSDAAVSNYFTATGDTTLGQITGSATLATFDSSSYYSAYSESYASEFSNGGVTVGLASGQTTAGATQSSNSASATASSSSTNTASASSTTSTTTGGAGRVTIAGGMLAAVFVGALVVL